MNLIKGTNMKENFDDRKMRIQRDYLANLISAFCTHDREVCPAMFICPVKKFGYTCNDMDQLKWIEFAERISERF